MTDIIAYIKRNNIEILNLKTGATASGTQSFTTQRLLVGQFSIAEKLFNSLMKEVKKKGFLAALLTKKHRIIVQPLEMIDGGLAEAEKRLFWELGAGGAGGKLIGLVKVHTGHKLSPQEAQELLKMRA